MTDSGLGEKGLGLRYNKEESTRLEDLDLVPPESEPEKDPHHL